MRLGLIGLGRIGAFHAHTLTALPAVESLVVTEVVARSRREHRPVRIDEVRVTAPGVA